MPLSTGERIGVFEIIGSLGAGGMGEVYRARDTRLNREVALKVLPPAFATDGDRLARFTREAQLLATLNHPNIAAIHGLEEAAGRTALVLELVEGATLGDRIAQGPLPLDEALAVAQQIVEALEAAHDRNIVHRDLKPGNIKVRPDGTVKVLDFGLAKALSRAESGVSALTTPDVTASPTVISPVSLTRLRQAYGEGGTEVGVILGTAAYMAPEQARGKTVDTRADIWAFGCVLYEMLTGKRTFPGDEVTDTLAAVLRGEPAWAALPSSTPHSIRRLLRRCLEKNPRERLQAIGDARLEIADASTLLGEDAAPAGMRESHRRNWTVPVVACVAAAVLAGFAVWTLKPSAPLPATRVTRSLVAIEPFDLRPPKPGATQIRPDRTAVTVSPDGGTLVFVGIATEVNPGGGTQSALFVRPLDSLTSVPLRTTTGAESPFFSPDGLWIGYWDGGELRRIPVSGSNTYTTIAAIPDGDRVFGASWGDDDRIVYAATDGLWRVAASGGTPERIVKTGDDEALLSLPHVLPGSESVLFTRQKTVFRWDDAQIVVRSLATGQENVLVDDAADARYVPTGHLVFMRRGKLMAAPFNLARLELTAGAVALVDDVQQAANMGNSTSDSGAGQFAVAADGTLVYVNGGVARDSEHELVWVDRSGKAEALSAPRREYAAPRLSPDGRRVLAFTGASAGDNGNRLWVYDIAQQTLTPITTADERILWGVWSPDGSRIAFQALLPGQSNISWKSADGTGKSQAITAAKALSQAPSSWSPDGHIVFVQAGSATNTDLWVVDPNGGTRPIVETKAREIHPAFSPDGKWLAYTSDTAGRWDVYVQPYPGPGPRVIVSPGGGTAPAWRGDGRELYYGGAKDGRNVMMAVSITPSAAGVTAGTPHILFEYRYAQTTPSRGYDVTPDGQRFLMVRGVEEPPSPPTQMVLVENWVEELKRAVPTRKP